MSVKVGINGFGRIGRNVFRHAMGNEDIEIVAVNDLTDADMLAHLLKYDSVHGTLAEDVSSTGSSIKVGDHEVAVLSESDPADLTWGDLGVEVVIEATGRFTDRASAQKHIDAGAKKVIITAPSSDDDLMIVLGVNDGDYKADEHHVVSNASCTTNCLAPFAKVLDEKFGIKRGLMTTVHAYTTDQQLLDLPHSDYHRARAAAVNMVPTSTGAAKAVGKVLPSLNGKLNGMAVRVPTPDGSIVDLVAELDQDVTAEEVNAAFKEAAEGDLAGILGYTEEPIVSSDIIGNPESSLIDGLSTSVIEDRMVKVISWYDNEMGYSARCVDLAIFMKEKGL